jgi:BirA family transcriptional regulator, biotin operon repressor / biotin---[acetyl-CoA-carboxylase] ligase
MTSSAPRIPTSPDGKRLQEMLAGTHFRRLEDIHLTYLQSVDSTQNFMTAVVRSDREGDLVISEVQTGGKGREGRSWISHKGGLWMTVTLKPPSAQLLENIVRVAATAIVRTLEALGIKGPVIKPPNDVYCNGKKIAGLLADTVIQGNNLKVFLGIGINVNNDLTKDYSISQIATSVAREVGRPVDLQEFTIAFLKNLDAEYALEIQSQRPQN